MAKILLCSNCGTQGKPKLKTKGSILIEIILWLCLIVPGLIYSIWRHTTRYKVCPACGSPNMIPLDSPTAQKISPGAIPTPQNYTPRSENLANAMARVVFYIGGSGILFLIGLWLKDQISAYLHHG